MRNGLVRESRNDRAKIDIHTSRNLIDIFDVVFKLSKRNRNIKVRVEKSPSV